MRRVGSRDRKRVTDRTVETPSYRYVLNMELMDFTGSSYVSMFNDDAEKLLGVTAAQLKTLNETNKEEYDNVFKRVLFKEYVFRLRVKVGVRMMCHADGKLAQL